MKKLSHSILISCVLSAMLFMSSCSFGAVVSSATTCAENAIFAAVVSYLTDGENSSYDSNAIEICVGSVFNIFENVFGINNSNVKISQNAVTLVTSKTQNFIFPNLFDNGKQYGNCANDPNYYNPVATNGVEPATIHLLLTVGKKTFASAPSPSDNSQEAQIADALITQFQLHFNQNINGYIHFIIPNETIVNQLSVPMNVSFEQGVAAVSKGKNIPWAYPISFQQNGNAKLTTVPCPITGAISAPTASCKSPSSATWQGDSVKTTQGLCDSDGFQLLQQSGAKTFAAEYFQPHNQTISPNFQVQVNIKDFLPPNTCAGIGLEQYISDTNDTIIPAFICANGSWTILTAPSDQGTYSKGMSNGGYTMTVTMKNNTFTLAINGNVVDSITIDSSFRNTTSIALLVDDNPALAYGQTRTDTAAATFNSFLLIPYNS